MKSVVVNARSRAQCWKFYSAPGEIMKNLLNYLTDDCSPPNDPAFPPSSKLPLVVPARDARTENYNGDRPNCAPHYTKRGAERRVIEQGREKCQSSSSAVPAS